MEDCEVWREARARLAAAARARTDVSSMDMILCPWEMSQGTRFKLCGHEARRDIPCPVDSLFSTAQGRQSSPMFRLETSVARHETDHLRLGLLEALYPLPPTGLMSQPRIHRKPKCENVTHLYVCECPFVHLEAE
ncbi:Kinesin-like protein KIF6, partial [Frankliniella fusca]